MKNDGGLCGGGSLVVLLVVLRFCFLSLLNSLNLYTFQQQNEKKNDGFDPYTHGYLSYSPRQATKHTHNHFKLNGQGFDLD